LFLRPFRRGLATFPLLPHKSAREFDVRRARFDAKSMIVAARSTDHTRQEKPACRRPPAARFDPGGGSIDDRRGPKRRAG